MQTHPLNITAAAPATSINIAGHAFRYISGSSVGDARIIVKPENGNEMELKPGQGFKLLQEVGRWFVKSYDGVSNITGLLNIGSGDFEDNNVTVGGTLSTNSTIVNQPTINLAAGSKVQEELLSYTGSYVTKAGFAAGSITQILAPAANVNGVIINRTVFGMPANAEIVLLAKASAPASMTDGDLVDFATNNTASNISTMKTDKIKVPAGKGLYIAVGSTAVNTLMNAVTYTVL